MMRASSVCLATMMAGMSPACARAADDGVVEAPPAGPVTADTPRQTRRPEPARKWVETVAAATRPTITYRALKAAQVLEKGTYLGVASSPATGVLRKQLKLPDGTGLVVDYVEPGSPAQTAGLEPYDVVTRLNEQILVNPPQLAVLVRTFEPGTQVQLTLLRAGKETNLPVTLVERDVKPLAMVKYGLTFVDSTSELEMLLDPANPIGVGDSLRVSIDDLEGAGKQTIRKVTVDDQGRITLPRLKDPVPAAGMSIQQLHKAIFDRYAEERIVQNANVAVEILGKNGGAGVGGMPRPARLIRQNDLLRLAVRDVEQPGVTTLKTARVGPAGTLQLPQLKEPLRVVGCTAEQLTKTVRHLYREAGVEDGGWASVVVMGGADDLAPPAAATPSPKPSQDN